MTSDASSPQGTDPAAVPPSSVPPSSGLPPVGKPPVGKPPAAEPGDREPGAGAGLATTRAAAAWLATAAALVVLALLIILILQNQKTVEVHYLGLAGSLPLGTALLIAAVAGGVIVMIVGVVRLTQLRVNARRVRRREAATTT